MGNYKEIIIFNVSKIYYIIFYIITNIFSINLYLTIQLHKQLYLFLKTKIKESLLFNIFNRFNIIREMSSCIFVSQTANSNNIH